MDKSTAVSFFPDKMYIKQRISSKLSTEDLITIKNKLQSCTMLCAKMLLN